MITATQRSLPGSLPKSTAELTEFVSKSHELVSQYSDENGRLEEFKKLWLPMSLSYLKETQIKKYKLTQVVRSIIIQLWSSSSLDRHKLNIILDLKFSFHYIKLFQMKHNTLLYHLSFWSSSPKTRKLVVCSPSETSSISTSSSDSAILDFGCERDWNETFDKGGLSRGGWDYEWSSLDLSDKEHVFS